MANARQIVKRRKSVTNIKKITRTMQLIATARFQQAYNRATAGKPYTKKITELVQQLSRAGGQISDPLLKENNDAPADMLLVITSNRGLCGGYNTNVLSAAMNHVKAAGERNIELHCVGKKGIAYFKFLKRSLASAVTSIDDRPRYEQVEPIAEQMMADYRAGKFGKVSVAYMRFISTGRQRPEVLQLLPMTIDDGKSGETPVPQHSGEVQYDFSPAPEELLKALLPQSVKVRLYQCFTDAAVSEQVARMVAMKSATDAAGDMIKDLTRRYNRARQSQITLELLDIVGGAEALK